MSGSLVDPSSDLELALKRRGEPMSAEEFLAVLEEISGLSSEPLTLPEREFLIEHADLTPEDLSESGRAATRLDIARSSAGLARAALDGALSTSEVAELLGRQESNVRRSRLAGDLFALTSGGTRELRFPRWQFLPDNTVLPGLRRIIPAFPRHTHPAAIESVMTTPREELEGLSPAQWLGERGPVEAVVELVEELGYE